ncbi:MAG: hypothetical protein EHM23_00880 [Acidobacteria bacterium]|nr:MAG: hypothetical protein EHM23_00880 [Acidobacteriota bacterium]
MVNQHRHFNGATSYMMWLQEARKTNGRIRGFGYGHEERNDTGIDILLNGDETYVDRANALVDQIAAEVEIPRSVTRRSVQGFRPNVPAFIRGEPRDMWRRVKIKEDRSPIRVFVGLTSSAMIDEDDLIKRGCAIAAFAIAMSNVRPVIITPYVCLGSSRYTGRGTRNMLLSWDISTQPLILSELMAVTRPEVTRHIGIEACRQLFGPIAQDDPSFHSDSFSEAKMRVHLNAKPDDLYLPSIHASDPILNNPVKWVNDQVNKYTSGEVTDLDITPEDY